MNQNGYNTSISPGETGEFSLYKGTHVRSNGGGKLKMQWTVLKKAGNNVFFSYQDIKGLLSDT